MVFLGLVGARTGEEGQELAVSVPKLGVVQDDEDFVGLGDEADGEDEADDQDGLVHRFAYFKSKDI